MTRTLTDAFLEALWYSRAQFEMVFQGVKKPVLQKIINEKVSHVFCLQIINTFLDDDICQ